MDKKKVSYLTRTITFITIFLILFKIFQSVFGFKYSDTVRRFYDLPKNSVDVLVVGSSHAYHNVDPNVFWEREGITGYVMGSASQMVWNSYHYIKEAVKYQKPKVVFLECYKTYHQEDYSDDAVAIKSASDMKLSLNYIENLCVSIEDKEKLLDSVLMFPWYHTRYTELKKKDFRLFFPDQDKDSVGFLGMKKIKKETLPENIKEIDRKEPLSKKVTEYLDRIVDLSRKEGFHLVFLITPFCDAAGNRQPYYNSLEDYAKEHGIFLINGNYLYEEMGLDGDSDFSTGNHLRISGAEKMSNFLCDYLDSNFTFQDHRGDPYYDRWERNRIYMNENMVSDLNFP